MSAAAVALIALLQTTPAPAAVQIPADPAVLSSQVLARDAELFDTMFNRCEPDVLAGLVTPDIEFYHDKGGAMIGSAAFLADYRKGCEARRASDAWRSRRELVAGSARIYPIPGVGAVEEGAHVFYERQGDGPETLVGRARFSVLWKLEDGQWRMARAFSIDHSAVP